MQRKAVRTIYWIGIWMLALTERPFSGLLADCHTSFSRGCPQWLWHWYRVGRNWQIAKQLDHFRFLQERDHENGDFKAAEYLENISPFLQEKHKIDKAMQRYTSRTAALDS